MKPLLQQDVSGCNRPRKLVPHIIWPTGKNKVNCQVRALEIRTYPTGGGTAPCGFAFDGQDRTVTRVLMNRDVQKYAAGLGSWLRGSCSGFLFGHQNRSTIKAGILVFTTYGTGTNALSFWPPLYLWPSCDAVTGLPSFPSPSEHRLSRRLACGKCNCVMYCRDELDQVSEHWAGGRADRLFPTPEEGARPPIRISLNHLLCYAVGVHKCPIFRLVCPLT